MNAVGSKKRKRIAARFALASVDRENFSDELFGGLFSGDDFKLRAALGVQYIGQIRNFAQVDAQTFEDFPKRVFRLIGDRNIFRRRIGNDKRF